MRIKAYTFRLARDFSADYECEHCGAIESKRQGYDDAHFHERIIPSFHCSSCGKNRAGEKAGSP